MKLSTSTIWQALALVVGAYSHYSNLVPADDKPLASFIVAGITLALHIHAGFHNPDGTPSRNATASDAGPHQPNKE